jgi:prefoldin subunit 5
MGYYVITSLIKERINMTIETMRETINTIKSVDGMKAVKVAFDLSATTQDSITKITEVVSLIDNNLKSLAVKVMELEKKLEAYERPKN